jgi:hypothetical protein
MRTASIMLCLVALVPASGWTQQLLVFPVVTDSLPGRYDSEWETLVRMIKVDPRDPVTIRRKWVCLPGGGFVDDPADAPFWDLTGQDVLSRSVIVFGDSLLRGTDASVGAVGLEVDGGPVLAHANVADVTRGYSKWFGTGQYVAAVQEPLVGPSHIQFVGGCRWNPCSEAPPEAWQNLRNNIGIVNPNPDPLLITGTVIPFPVFFYVGGPVEYPDEDPETFVREVPPYGWLQFHWEATRAYWLPWEDISPAYAGFVISLTPDGDQPYYAYASIVFSPDPASGTDGFSDPMFVPAEPGYIAPIREVVPGQ